jgi:hypothetical protein
MCNGRLPAKQSSFLQDFYEKSAKRDSIDHSCRPLIQNKRIRLVLPKKMTRQQTYHDLIQWLIKVHCRALCLTKTHTKSQVVLVQSRTTAKLSLGCIWPPISQTKLRWCSQRRRSLKAGKCLSSARVQLRARTGRSSPARKTTCSCRLGSTGRHCPCRCSTSSHSSRHLTRDGSPSSCHRLERTQMIRKKNNSDRVPVCRSEQSLRKRKSSSLMRRSEWMIGKT